MISIRSNLDDRRWSKCTLRWSQLRSSSLVFCVCTFCVNVSTVHVARPARGDPTCLRLHIFVLVCRGVIRHTDKWGSHSKGILRIFFPIHKLRNLVGLVCEWTVCRNQVWGPHVLLHDYYILMSIELILLASSLNFVAFSRFYEHLDGQIMALFMMALAACETAVGLALFILMYRRYHSVDTDRLQSLRG